MSIAYIKSVIASGSLSYISRIPSTPRRFRFFWWRRPAPEVDERAYNAGFEAGSVLDEKRNPYIPNSLRYKSYEQGWEDGWKEYNSIW